MFPNITTKFTGVDHAIQLEWAAKGDFDVQAYCYIHEPTAVAHMKTTFHAAESPDVHLRGSIRWSPRPT